MQTLGELRYAFIMIPLLFVLIMNIINHDIANISINLVVSILVGSALIIISSVNIVGSGVNAEGTFLLFTVGFALSFWGLSLLNFVGIAILPMNIQTYTISFNYTILGWTGTELISVLLGTLSFFYGLGIYFLVASRGH
jgi:hypothetical protein